MKRSSWLGLAGLTGVLGITAFAVATRGSAMATGAVPAPTAVFPSHELEALDRVVQARFAVVPRDGSFGYDRVVPRILLHGGFYPDSKPEQVAVAKLRATKQQVVFYLVGRARTAASPMQRPRVQGPLVMTPHLNSSGYSAEEGDDERDAQDTAMSTSAPKQQAFLPLANEVLTQAKPDAGAQKQVGEWKVVACPIPASSPACVTCHNNMAQAAAKLPSAKGAKPELISLHDPLGVALYCVRTAPKATAKQQTTN